VRIGAAPGIVLMKGVKAGKTCLITGRALDATDLILSNILPNNPGGIYSCFIIIKNIFFIVSK
jgi:hypothetical protein